MRGTVSGRETEGEGVDLLRVWNIENHEALSRRQRKTVVFLKPVQTSILSLKKRRTQQRRCSSRKRICITP